MRERRNLTDMALTKGNFLLPKLSLGQNGDQKFEEKLNKNRSLRALEMRYNSQCIRMDSGLWTCGGLIGFKYTIEGHTQCGNVLCLKTVFNI